MVNITFEACGPFSHTLTPQRHREMEFEPMQPTRAYIKKQTAEFLVQRNFLQCVFAIAYVGL